MLNRNHKISGKGLLLNEDGSLKEPGWANRLVFDYDPQMVKEPMRLKEWDYYHIIDSDGRYAVSFTFADNRYMGLVNCAVFDFEEGKKYPYLELKVFPMGKLNLPRTSEEGNIEYRSKFCDYHIDRDENGRHFYCKYYARKHRPELEADIYLEQPPMDTMVIATPWNEKKSAFYYNQKIPCMPASGYVKLNGKTYTFDSSKDFGVLDWGRGSWTYDNTWYWGIGSGIVNGKPFGYNIGYGFGNTKNASENMIFYDGKCHKLDLVDFGIPTTDVMKKWFMTSNDDRWKMEFTPFYNDKTDLKFPFVSQQADKLFGKLNGTVVLDDGTALKIENLVGFHEKVHNRW